MRNMHIWKICRSGAGIPCFIHELAADLSYSCCRLKDVRRGCHSMIRGLPKLEPALKLPACEGRWTMPRLLHPAPPTRFSGRMVRALPLVCALESHMFARILFLRFMKALNLGQQPLAFQLPSLAELITKRALVTKLVLHDGFVLSLQLVHFLTHSAALQFSRIAACLR